MSEYTLGLFFGIAIGIIMLVSIDRSLSAKDFLVGAELCSNNGGLSYISFDAKDKDFHCNNLAVFPEPKKETK